MNWTHIDNGHPATRLVVLCFGCPTFQDVEPAPYLAWWNIADDSWICDATGQRVNEPTWWTQVQPPSRWRVAFSVAPNPGLEHACPVRIDGFNVVEASSAEAAEEAVGGQLADLFFGHEVFTKAVHS